MSDNQIQKAGEPKSQFKNLLDTLKPSIAAVLPRHLTPERMLKAALVAASTNKKLYRCTSETIARSVITASQLGLDCSGALGEAYLIPFDNSVKDGSGAWHKETQCSLIIGYRGMISLARRSGQIESISVRDVCQGDKFSVVWGDDERIVHEPNMDVDRNRQTLIGVYLIAKFKDGGIYREFMSKSQIEKVRLSSRNAETGPWRDHYMEMAKKTVVRRAFKWLPMSIELQETIAAVAERTPEVASDIIDTTASEKIDVAEDGGGEFRGPPEGAPATLSERVEQLRGAAKSDEGGVVAPQTPVPAAEAAHPTGTTRRPRKAVAQPQEPDTMTEDQAGFLRSLDS